MARLPALKKVRENSKCYVEFWLWDFFSPKIHALVFTSWIHAEWDNLAIFNPLWSSPTPKQTNESATANEKAWCTLYNSYTNLQITFFSRQKKTSLVEQKKRTCSKAFDYPFIIWRSRVFLYYRRFYLLFNWANFHPMVLLRQSFLFPFLLYEICFVAPLSFSM